MIFVTAALLFALAFFVFFSSEDAGDFFVGLGGLVFILGVVVTGIKWSLAFITSYLPFFAGLEPYLRLLFIEPYGIPTWQYAAAAVVLFFLSLLPSESSKDSSDTSKTSKSSSKDSDTESSRTTSSDGSKSKAAKQADHTFPWIGDNNRQLKTACPTCDKSIHNTRSAFTSHWRQSSTCAGPPLELPESVDATQSEWDDLVERYGDHSSDDATSTEQPDEPTREELLDELRRLKREQDPSLSRGTVVGYGQYSLEQYRDEFGDWWSALELVEDQDTTDPSSDSDQQPTAEAKTAEIRSLLDEVETACTDVESITDANQIGSATETLETAEETLSEADQLVEEYDLDEPELNDRLDRLKARLESALPEWRVSYLQSVKTAQACAATAERAATVDETQSAIESYEEAIESYTDAIETARQVESDTDQSATDIDALDARRTELRVKKAEQLVKRAEAEIASLVERAVTAREQGEHQEEIDLLNLAAKTGEEGLGKVDRSLDDPELQTQITAVENTIAELRSKAERRKIAVAESSKHEPGRADDPDTGTASADSVDEVTEPSKTGTAKISTSAEIADTPSLSAPVVLQITEELQGSDRCRQFKATGLAGEPFRLDVWQRHALEFDFQSDWWYEFTAVRGQRVDTADGSVAVVSTTPETEIIGHGTRCPVDSDDSTPVRQ